jgi:hypothetical protein
MTGDHTSPPKRPPLTARCIPCRGTLVAAVQFAFSQIREAMTHQKAIFVPGHGVPEAVRSVRFVPRKAPAGGPNVFPDRPSATAPPPVVEIWPGDLYGEPGDRMLTSFSTSERTETVFPEDGMPVVPPGKSLVAVIREPPAGWEVEFYSTFTDRGGKTVPRTVTIDNYGTAHESLDVRKV